MTTPARIPTQRRHHDAAAALAATRQADRRRVAVQGPTWRLTPRGERVLALSVATVGATGIGIAAALLRMIGT